MSGKTRGTIGNILTIVGAFVGEGFSWTGWGAVIGAALIIIGGVLAQDGAKRQQKEAERRARASGRSPAVKGNIRGSHEHHLIVFGKVRVGGIICTLGTSNDIADPSVNNNLHIGIAHSIVHPGGCEGITDIWIDDTRITAAQMTGDPNVALATVNTGVFNGLVKVRHHRGTGTQAPSSDLTAPSVNVDTASDYRRGIAWTHFWLVKPASDETFRKAFKFGIPNCAVELKGWRCYDPRLDSTNGGSGTHRVNDETTWAWTQNPILCAATYHMVSELHGGMGVPQQRTDWASVASAASVCDEVITTPDGDRARFLCDGVLNTADKRDVNLQKIMDACMGRRVRVGSKYKFYAASYRTPTVAIDQTWLSGAVRISTRHPLESLYNAVRINFDDASQDYKTIEAPPYTSAAYEAQDGGYRVWRDMTLPMVSNTYGAQYLAQIEHKRSRKQMTVALQCNLKALDVEVWETCTLSLPDSTVDLSSRVFRVEGWEFTPAGIRLSLVEDASSIYTVDTFLSPSTGTPLQVGSETPGAVTGFAGAVVAKGISLTFTPPAAFAYKHIEVLRSTTSGSGFAVIGRVPADGTAHFDGTVTSRVTYYYKLRARSPTGTLGPETSELSFTAGDNGDSGPTAVLNAGFELELLNWVIVSGGWVADSNQGTQRTGVRCAKLPGTGISQSGVLKSSQIVPVAQGDLVLITAFLRSTASADGTGRVRISWLDSTVAEIATSNGNAITAGVAYRQSRISAAAPANAAYAVFQFEVLNFTSASSQAWFADDALLTINPKDLDELPDGPIYGKTKQTALTGGEVDMTKAGVLNRNADNLAETVGRKWAAESGAQVVTGKSIDILADGTTYQRTKATALTAGEVDLAKAGVIGKNLDNVADTATYGRVKGTALTAGEVDMTKVGVLNRNADNLAETVGRKWAAESGANITETRTAAAIAGQGALATKSAVDLATAEVTNKNADQLAETAGRKWAAESGATVGAVAGTNLKAADLTPLDTIAHISIAEGYRSSTQQIGGYFSDSFDDPDSPSYWEEKDGNTSGKTRVAIGDSKTSGYMLRLGDNVGNDEAWLLHKRIVPFDQDKLYLIRARVRRISGTGKVYLGVAGVGSDGVTLVNTTGANSHTSQHFVCASDVEPSSSWTVYSGYFQGTAATGSSTPGTPTSPAKLHTSVRYLRPLILANYLDLAGQVEVDYIEIVDALAVAGVRGLGITGLQVYKGLNGANNEHEFYSLLADEGVQLTLDDVNSVIKIKAKATEKDHLYLHSDRAESGTTLVNVTDFKFALEANSVYRIEVRGRVRTAATTTGFKFGATAPASSTMEMLLETPDTSGSTTGKTFFATGTTSVSATATDMPAATTDYPFRAVFIVVTGATAGDFQTQFASEVVSSTATLKAYTNMTIQKLTSKTPSANLTLQNPGFGLAYTSDDVVLSGTATAQLVLRCKGDGTWTIAGGTNDTVAGTPLSGNWGTPTTGGAGADYEVQYVVTNSTGTGTISNPASSFTNLLTDQVFTLTVSSTAGIKSHNLDVQMIVRKVGTTTPVADDTMDWTVTAEREV